MAPARKSQMLKASLCLVALLLSASIAPSFAHADTSAPTLKHAGRGLLQLDSDVVEDSLDNLQLPDEEALSPGAEDETTIDSVPPVAESPAGIEDADGPEASATSSTSVESDADGPSDDEAETEGPTASVAEAEGPAAEGPGAEDLEEDLFIEEDLATSPKPEPEFEITESSGSSMATVGVFGLGLVSSVMLGLLF